jgi:hypothetical protein
MLLTGAVNGWMRGTAIADASGNLIFADCSDSSGGTTCPAGMRVWTIITSTGVIAESGTGSDPNAHYTMASNKKLITGTLNGTSYPSLLIAQKKVPGTVYAAADLYNKSFVFHQLFVGNYTGAAGWSYGVGSTNGSGLATSSSETNSWGSSSPGSPGTLSVDTTGVVTISGDTSWNGFFSADKKTIVGVSTSDHGGGDYSYTLMIIQITSGQSSSVSSIVGTSYLHMLAAGSDPAPFWAHQPIDITSAGLMTLGLWECSNVSESGHTGTATMSISSSGTATVIPSAGTSDFHGQLSYDGTFMIGVETYADGAFALDVFTYSHEPDL